MVLGLKLIAEVPLPLPPLAGPGLAIRVLCQSEAYISEDFSLTNTLLANIVDFCRASQQPSAMVQAVQECTSPPEQDFLQRVTLEGSLAATLLPIYSVGVQVSNRSSLREQCVCSRVITPTLAI